jgi:hypothetical protein
VAPVRRWLLGLVLVALLVPAATLTAVRLLDLDSGLAIRLVSFTPLALPLYAAAVLLLAVLVVVRGRTRLAVVLVPALLGLGLHAWWFAPMVSGGQPDTSGRTWTVMTSNLLAGQGDGLEVLRAATEGDVDVLVLEEVTTGVLAEMERGGLSERFPHHIGEARPDGQTDGTMVWSRVPLSGTTRVGTDMQSWSVEVRDPREEPFTLLAVHPAAPVDPAAWRRDHAAVLAAAERTGADLLVGDLNATLDHVPLRRLVDAGWRDATEEADAGWQPTWPSNGLFEGLPLPALVQIDHVLTGPGWVGLASRTVQVDGTDHRALVAEVARRR